MLCASFDDSVIRPDPPRPPVHEEDFIHGRVTYNGCSYCYNGSKHVFALLGLITPIQSYENATGLIPTLKTYNMKDVIEFIRKANLQF